MADAPSSVPRLDEALAIGSWSVAEQAAALEDRRGGEPAEVDSQSITTAHLRELLGRLDALCPGWLQAPCGGSVHAALTDPVSGRLRAVVPIEELCRLDGRGCPDHPSGDCGCPVLDRPVAAVGYRPRRAQYRFVTTRDGTCRMPGCCIRAGHADLDHVLPHPEGATDCTDLCCLCRRHHRLETHGPRLARRHGRRRRPHRHHTHRHHPRDETTGSSRAVGGRAPF